MVTRGGAVDEKIWTMKDKWMNIWRFLLQVVHEKGYKVFICDLYMVDDMLCATK